MKKYVVTTALAAGFSMIAGAAHAQVVGTVGANYSRADTDAGDADSYGVSGGITIPTGGNLAVLLDGSWQTNDDADVDVLAGTAHLISRNDDHAFGGFLGLLNADGGGGADLDAWGGGGEFAKFMGSRSALALNIASPVRRSAWAATSLTLTPTAAATPPCSASRVVSISATTR